MAPMTTFTIQHEREEDGRWLAEVPELPGVLAYGDSADEAMAKAQALALRVLAEVVPRQEQDRDDQQDRRDRARGHPARVQPREVHARASLSHR